MKNLSFLLLLCSIGLFAQRNNPMTLYEQSWKEHEENQPAVARSYVELSMGIALPGNTYGAATANQQSGFAKNGLITSLSGALLLYKNAGISGTLGHYSSALLASNYRQTLLQNLPQEFSGTLQAQKWQNTFFAIGPFVMIPENRIMLDLHIQAGLLNSRSPQTVFTASNAETQLTQVQQAVNATAFATLIGAQISYGLPHVQSLRLVVKANFIGAAPVFNTSKHTQTNDVVAQTTQSYRQSVGIFTLGFGLRHEFISRKKVLHK